MRPKERRDSGHNDLFPVRLDQIVDMDHGLARLGRTIDWRFLEERFGAVYSDKTEHPKPPTRLMAGLAILKHMYNVSAPRSISPRTATVHRPRLGMPAILRWAYYLGDRDPGHRDKGRRLCHARRCRPPFRGHNALRG